MALVHGRVDAAPVVRATAGQGGHGFGYLVKQRTDLGGIIDVTVGQRGCNDPPAARIHADVQGAPGAPPLGAVLLDQPFARPAQLQPGAVDQQVDGPAAQARRFRQRHRSGAAGEGGVIRHRQFKPEQLEDGADQPLGLA